jgi:hypothetical protein
LGKTRLSNGSEKRVCKNCASKYQTCTLCSYLVAPNKLVPIDEHKVCPRCLKEHSAICPQCRETHLSSTFIRVNGTSICRKCFRVAYYTCASCYSVRAIGDEYIDPITKEYYCKACVNKKYNTSIQEYNLKPIPKWFGKGTSLYMGFELEAEMENVSSVDVIKYLHENELCKELFYYKHDGSLMNGIEIVSHPFAFQWLKENSNIIKHLHGLTSRGCKSYHTKTCGFHVHMTKSAFTSIQLFKFMKLFYENPDFIRYISQRRSPERMDNYATLEGGNLYERAKSKSNPGEARRGAVNTAPKNTVEVRIFQGNLSETRIWKNLEFCYGVYEFSNVIDIPSITVDNFKAFISKTPKVYKNLIAFLDNQKVEED